MVLVCRRILMITKTFKKNLLRYTLTTKRTSFCNKKNDKSIIVSYHGAQNFVWFYCCLWYVYSIILISRQKCHFKIIVFSIFVITLKVLKTRSESEKSK